MFNRSFLLFLQALLQHHFLKEACSDTLQTTFPILQPRLGCFGFCLLFYKALIM